MCNGYLGRINMSKHRVHLYNDELRAVHYAPYRAESTASQLAVAESNRMLAKKVIEPEPTKRAASIMFAPKKDGSLRFFVDYRKLSAETVYDSYPLRSMDACIDS